MRSLALILAKREDMTSHDRTGLETFVVRACASKTISISKRALHALSLRCVPKLHVSDFVPPRSHSQHNLRRTALSLGSLGFGPTQSNAPAPLAGLHTGWTLWPSTGAVDDAWPPLAVLRKRILDIAAPSLISRRLSSWRFSMEALRYAPYVLLAAGCTPAEVRKPAQEALGRPEAGITTARRASAGRIGSRREYRAAYSGGRLRCGLRLFFLS